MIAFKEFLEKKLNRKCVMLMYDHDVQIKLRQFCLDHGLDICKNYEKEEISPEEFEFHTTIYYSDTSSSQPLEDGEYPCEEVITHPIKFDRLGKEEKNCLCLCLEVTPSLERLRHKYAEEYGMSDSWPTYKPHITLSYNGTTTNFPPIMPKFPLRASRIKVSSIKE